MFNQINCGGRFQQQSDYIGTQFPYPGEAISYYQINPQFWTYQSGIFQNNTFYDYSEPTQYSEIPTTSSDFSSFSEAEETGVAGQTGVEEAEPGKTGVQEAEAVDELLQILVECLKNADIRTREVLLKKFFFEIEKETNLEGFLVERIKHSKIKMLCERINPCRSRDIYKSDQTGGKISVSATREVEAGEKSSKKLERFKVKTIQVGEIVKEEAK